MRNDIRSRFHFAADGVEDWIVSFDDVGLLGSVWFDFVSGDVYCVNDSLCLSPLSHSLSDCVMHARMGFSGLVQCSEI